MCIKQLYSGTNCPYTYTKGIAGSGSGERGGVSLQKVALMLPTDTVPHHTCPHTHPHKHNLHMRTPYRRLHNLGQWQGLGTFHHTDGRRHHVIETCNAVHLMTTITMLVVATAMTFFRVMIA